MKKIADMLTASRGLIAGIIVLLGFGGRAALPAVIALIIIGWTTDILDGKIARHARAKAPSHDSFENSWLGEHDFTIDMIMVFASFVYLVFAGFISPELALGYILLAALFILWSSGSKSVTELFAFPLVALPLIIAYSEESWIAYVYIGWVILALILGWQRFTGVVREFIDDVKRLRKT
jgi:hypothetical protein